MGNNSQRDSTISTAAGQGNTGSYELPQSPQAIVNDRLYGPGSEYPAAERIVFSFLSQRMDKYGKAWPAVAYICDRCNLSSATVRKAIKSLIEKNQITASYPKTYDRDGESFKLYGQRMFTLVHNVASFAAAADRREQAAEAEAQDAAYRTQVQKKQRVRRARTIFGLKTNTVPLSKADTALKEQVAGSISQLSMELIRNRVDQETAEVELNKRRISWMPKIDPDLPFTDVLENV